MHHEPEQPALLGKDEQVLVSIGHEQVLGEVVELGGRTARSYPTPALRPVLGQAGALDITLARDGDDHRLVGNHVDFVELATNVIDFRAPAVAVAVLDFLQLIADNLLLHLRRSQYLIEVVNLPHQLLELGHDFVALQAREALQAHIQNGAGLYLAQSVLFDELRAGGIAVAGASDKGNNLVQVVEGDEQTLQDVGSFLGLGQLVAGTTHDNVGPVLDEILNQLLEVERHRPALHQADIIDAERALQLGFLIQVVEDHRIEGILLQVIHDAHPVAVRLVAQVRNALDDLVVNQGRRALNHAGLVHHVGNLGHHNLVLARFADLEMRFGPHHDAAPPRLKRLPDALVAVDDATRGEVGRRDVLHELGDGDFVVFQIGRNAVDDLS